MDKGESLGILNLDFLGKSQFNDDGCDDDDDDKKDCDYFSDNYKYSYSTPLPFYVYGDLKYNRSRLRYIVLLMEIFSKHEIFAKKHVDDKIILLRRIELGCYNKIIDKARELNIRTAWEVSEFKKLYNNESYRISTNLDCRSAVGSSELLLKILNGKILPENLAKMDSGEFYPELYNKLTEKINRRRGKELKYRYTRLYKCHKCGKDKCRTENRQNKRADEGNNLYIICITCGHRMMG